MLHCLWDNQVFASYLEWTRIPCRRSSLLSTCVFIPKKPSDMQANWIVILVDHMLFSHTFISQMVIENINSASVVYIYAYYPSNPAWKNSCWCPLNPAMKLTQESWGSKCASHRFTACQRFLLVTPGHWKAFLQSEGFLLWIQLTCYRWFPDICIRSNDSPFLHTLCFKSQSIKRLYPWERIFQI